MLRCKSSLDRDSGLARGASRLVLSAEEVMLVTWVRCYDGSLLNLERADRVFLDPVGLDGKQMVVARLPGGTDQVIMPAVSPDKAEEVMERIFGQTVGYGECRLDFLKQPWAKPRISQIG